MLREYILANAKHFLMQNGILHNIWSQQGKDPIIRVVIPDSLKSQVLYCNHDGREGGHM